MSFGKPKPPPPNPEIDVDEELTGVIHIFHHFPDPIEIDLKVTMDQVPTSLGLVPGETTPKE